MKVDCIKYHSGTVYYGKNKIYHNESGPAIIWNDGDISWYLDGIRYTESKWLNKVLFNEVKIELYEP